VVDCLVKDSGIKTVELKVDGGACKNDFLMQFQSDILGVPVLRPKIVETTARGSGFLAGLAVGFWKDQKDLQNAFELDKRFDPVLSEKESNKLYSGWCKAVERSRNWAVDE
jgi:glycerol kinase